MSLAGAQALPGGAGKAGAALFSPCVFGNCSRIGAEQEGFNALLGIAWVLLPERVRGEGQSQHCLQQEKLSSCPALPCSPQLLPEPSAGLQKGTGLLLPAEEVTAPPRPSTPRL